MTRSPGWKREHSEPTSSTIPAPSAPSTKGGEGFLLNLPQVNNTSSKLRPTVQTCRRTLGAGSEGGSGAGSKLHPARPSTCVPPNFVQQNANGWPSSICRYDFCRSWCFLYSQYPAVANCRSEVSASCPTLCTAVAVGQCVLQLSALPPARRGQCEIAGRYIAHVLPQLSPSWSHVTSHPLCTHCLIAAGALTYCLTYYLTFCLTYCLMHCSAALTSSLMPHSSDLQCTGCSQWETCGESERNARCLWWLFAGCDTVPGGCVCRWVWRELARKRCCKC